jgi:Xaa-Pro aminopeptidase
MRLAAFQKTLSLDAAIIENPVDLLYLTGLSLSKGILCITKTESILFVDGRYFEKAKREASCSVGLWEGESPWRWLTERRCASVAFDSAFTSYDQFVHLEKKRGAASLVPCSRLLKEQRGVKSQEELRALQNAADLTWEGYRHVIASLKEGISEEALAWEFESFVRTRGASSLSFEPIIAFGENSAYPHHRAGKSQLKQDQIVLIDVGAVLASYRGDLTRVHFFGRPDPALVEMLAWTRAAQEAAFRAVRPGALLGSVDRSARAIYVEKGVEALFSHGLGHGIGLETHEYPSLKMSGPDIEVPIAQGMVFTLEPGLYRPGVGGVRWEDIVVVTKEGARRLYPNGP